MKKLITILFLLVQLGYGQLSGTFTIGGGGDYDSLGAAINALNTSGINGAVTMYFLDGTHNIGANVALGCTGTSSTNTITFKPAIGATVIINFLDGTTTASIDGHWVIGSPNALNSNLIATNYVTIDGSNTNNGTSKDMTINGPVTSLQRSVFRVYGNNDNITIKNCIIINNSSSSSSTTPIMLTDYTTLAPDNFLAENNTLVGNSGNGALGFQASVSGSPTALMNGIKVRNNIITARATRAIMFNYVSSGEISGNTITHDCQLGTGAAATIYLTTGGSGVAGTFDVFSNKITQMKTWNTAAGPSASNGIIGIDNALATPKIVNIFNNFVSGFQINNASVQGVKVYGVRHSSSSISIIYGNTIYIPELTNMTSELNSYISGIAFATAASTEASPTGTMICKNNIILMNETSMKVYGIRRVGSSGTFYSDFNNIYYTPLNLAGNIGYWNSSDQQSFTDWKNNSSKDTNSVSKIVYFVSSTDLHLTGQSVGDYELAGTPIAGYTTDIDGQTRSTTYPYMGADENTNVVLAASYKRPVDGDAADWTGTASGTLHANVVSDEEAIYTGESGDSRTDQHGGDLNGDYNNDITEFRFTRDNSYLYFMVKFRDLVSLDRPYIAIGIDANQSDDTPVWLGDDSPVVLSPATNRAWERQLAIHATTSGVLNIEMFADDGSNWYAPLSNYQVSGSTGNNVIEFRVALHDLGITSSTTLNLAVATFNNNTVGYNNVVDATTGSFIDVVTPGYSGSNNAWFRAGESNTALNGNVSWNQSLSPLPVELTSFNANALGKDVKLNWSTSTEVNSYQFVVEKSENNGWNAIGSVNAAGNSNSPKVYSFTDNNLQPGKYQYRLKMIDNDGSYEYSSSVEVDIEIPKEFALMQNYPNPFNPVTNINYTIPVDSKVMLVIYSISGEKVAELVNESQAAGNYSIPFNASNLASGTYVYRLIANDFVQTKKMLLIK
jgi:hypothetical protein